jgi:chromosome segregation ATPase
MDKLREDLIKCERLKKELEVQNVTLLEQKNDLYLQLQTEQDAVADLEERVEKLVTQKADFEGQIKEMEELRIRKSKKNRQHNGQKKKGQKDKQLTFS